MKLRHAAALAIVGCYLMAPPTTMAMECEKDSLSDVSGSGAILEMLSGQIYKVDDVDQVDSALWLSAEDVLVCTEPKTIQGKRITIYKIINKDSNGEEVSASRVKWIHLPLSVLTRTVEVPAWPLRFTCRSADTRRAAACAGARLAQPCSLATPTLKAGRSGRENSATDTRTGSGQTDRTSMI